MSRWMGTRVERQPLIKLWHDQSNQTKHLYNYTGTLPLPPLFQRVRVQHPLPPFYSPCYKEYLPDTLILHHCLGGVKMRTIYKNKSIN